MPKKLNDHSRVPLGYGRLSKDEIDDTKEPTEIKLLKRKQIIIGLAAQHGLDLVEDNIYLEQQSAQRIDNRTEFLEVLRRIKAGECSHLLTPYQDRIMRGSKREEADIEDAFKDGEIIFVSTEGVMDFGDPDFELKHGLTFGVKNLVARQDIVRMSHKQRESNNVAVRAGSLYCGVAPFGYEWVQPVYNSKKLVEAGHYVTIPHEYELICEFFRRVRHESMNKIAREWNGQYKKTGNPDPTKAEHRPAQAWYPKTMSAWLNNPFYAGYPAKRYRTKNYGKKHELLDKENWLLADEEQPYPHPISLDEQEELQAIVKQRLNEGEPKLACDTILSGGLLYCAKDVRMRGNQHDYSCKCSEYGEKHQTKAISKPRIHFVAQQVVKDCIHALPEDLLKSSGVKKKSHGDINIQLASLKKRLRSEEQKAKDLMEYASMQISIYGKEKYEEVCKNNNATIQELKPQIEALSTELNKPDLTDIRPVLIQLLEYGFDDFWRDASREVIRDLITYFIAKIKLIAPGEGHKECKSVQVTLTDFALEYLPSDYTYRTEPFPLRGRAGLGLGKKYPLTRNGNRAHRKLPEA